MSSALRLALRDLYENSWRLVPFNVLLGLILAASAAVAIPFHAAAVLVVLAGPVAAALAHSAVTVVRTGNLTLGDGLRGLQRHWRRGLGLAALAGALLLIGVVAIRFYGGSSLAWPLAFVVFYAGVCAGVLLMIVWVLAVAEPERSLRASAAVALELVARRPGATAVLGLVLLLVNLAGIAVAVMPFLTFTVAYSFVAVARFALPPTPEETA